MEGNLIESGVIGLLAFMVLRLVERQSETSLRYAEHVAQLVKNHSDIAEAVSRLAKRVSELEGK